ncbi:N-acetylglucosamine-1-phosphodiester alpha-N-acetylglucosaminidase, partial [Camelus dromedarius]
PLRTFSVLEPGGSGGCASRRRTTVEETARAAGCSVAQNGGFFRMDTGECLGNVVSDGRRVSSAGGLQNAQFGIRRDGTLVTGYLSEEEVLDTENPFVQLLSGVVWLIRNGSIYINESQAAECNETQETGSFSKFVNVISARTAVGHDRKGRLVLFHVDGQTEQRGINLWEMAEFLLKQDVVNAINLDGGGSATFVLNGTLASYPSDHCQDNMWRCPRRVSTVVCLHEPRCQPPDCNGHGTCVEGRCQCSGHFWQGAACNELDCGPANCSQHGLCTESEWGSAGGSSSLGSPLSLPQLCLGPHLAFSVLSWQLAATVKLDGQGPTAVKVKATRPASFLAPWAHGRGESPSPIPACTNGSFGEECAKKCQCHNGATCDPVQGTCTCPPGFTGDTCVQECPLGWYGPGCQSPCKCEHQCPCDPQTGNCSLARAPTLTSILSQVKQCLLPPEATLKAGELSLFTRTTWLALTLALVFLLLISAAANVSLFLGSRTERRRHLDGAYVYHPLQEMNGELLASEKEQLGDTCNPFKD